MTLSYEEIRQKSKRIQPVSDQEIAAVQRDYSDLPPEYLELLTEVGSGEICGLMFYSVPLDLDEIFDEETVADSPRIALIADDLAGGHLGYLEVDGAQRLTFFDHMDLPDVEPSSRSTLLEFLTWWSSP